MYVWQTAASEINMMGQLFHSWESYMLAANGQGKENTSVPKSWDEATFL